MRLEKARFLGLGPGRGPAFFTLNKRTKDAGPLAQPFLCFGGGGYLKLFLNWELYPLPFSSAFCRRIGALNEASKLVDGGNPPIGVAGLVERVAGIKDGA